MPSNREISRLFDLYAELLDVHGQEERLSDLLSGAAYRVGRLDQELGQFRESQLTELFCPEVVSVLTEVKKTGSIAALEDLIQLTPAGLFDMMRIKGLGGKKLSVLWKTAKLDTIEDLLLAAKAGTISQLPGFGKKTEQNIIAGIEAFNERAERFHYAAIADLADELVAALRKQFKTQLVSLCGDIRRQETVVDRMEVLIALPVSHFKNPELKRIMTIAEQTAAITTGHTLDEVPVTLYHCTVADYYCQLLERTGNASHVQKINARIAGPNTYRSEEAIYDAAGLPFIVPEMRQDIAEWDWTEHPEPLITNADITGVVHNHTDWSDGVDRLDAFVLGCQRKGYAYTVISDHSQNAHYAGGLKPDKVLRQFEAIDKLNKKVGPFKIFKSIECDILVSGELDYDPELLSRFDMVIISVHQQLKMAEEKATARLIKAIENPFTTILGHLTGRQLLVRPGYPLDFKKVIDACAANGVVIEINANPYRLDMDWSHIPYALKKGVMISINPDAHSIHEIDNIRWGVSAARKGGLTKTMTWNAQPLTAIEEWLAGRRAAIEK
jgi:DNA polymerase (family 10)